MEEDLDTILNSINNSYSQKFEKYGMLCDVLEKEPGLLVMYIKKIFIVTTKDLLKDNLKYAKHILNIWLQILKEFEIFYSQLENEDEKKVLEPVLVSSAVKNMKLLDKVASANVFNDLNELSYEVMKSYPKEIIIEIASKHHRPQLYSLITSILNSKCAVSISENTSLFTNEDLKNGIMIFDILKITIEALPPDIKREFMEGGLHVWFSYLIPYTFSLMYCNKLKSHPIFVQVLDLLIEELSKINFKNNKEWQKLLKSITRPNAYPGLMKASLENKSNNWVVMLCVIVKLLKNHITTGIHGQELHINCIAPVLESAFKMDIESRCGAFYCWQVLAKYFESVNYQKSISFLMIPMETNNAKDEKVAIAKFNCWWHIIKCFQLKLNSCDYSPLLRFLEFCLGLNDMLSIPEEHKIMPSINQFKKVTKLGMEAFLNIIGHGPDCKGCVKKTIPQLDSKILTGELFKNYLHCWLQYLKGATIILAYSENSSEAKKQTVCIWTSFFNVIALEENNNELTCALLKKSLEILQENEKTSELIFHAISGIFKNRVIEEKLIGQIDTDNVISGPISIIIKLVTHPYFRNYMSSYAKTLSEGKLDHNMINVAFKLECIAFIKHLLVNSQAATVLSSYICDNNDNISRYSAILMWSLEKATKFSDELSAAKQWGNLYNLCKLKFNNTKEIEKKICVLLSSCENHTIFTIIVLCNVIKHGDQDLILQQIEILYEMLSSKKDLQLVFLVLNETLTSALKKLFENDDTITAKYTMGSINIILKSMFESYKQGNDGIYQMMENMLNNINKLIKNKNYSESSSLISEIISKIGASNMPETCVKLSQGILEFIVKSIMSDDDNNIIENPINSKDKEIDKIAPISRVTDQNSLENKENSSDCVSKVVVQNGENVLVVDSNKKFNPRKLTEHQKEVMQRKRDDIPALYQDLSQSQDEFKKKYWVSTYKIDTNKNSEINNVSKEVTTPAKNFNGIGNDLDANVISEPKTLTTPTVIPSTNKKPRLPFKERVMLNVKNLLHKSDINAEIETVPTDVEVTTPTKPIVIRSEIMNSAPANISTSRSNRIKRKPKKYELDYELPTTTKRTNLISDKQNDSAAKKKRNIVKDDDNRNEKCSMLNNVNNDQNQSNEATTIEESEEIQDNHFEKNDTQQLEAVCKNYEVTETLPDSNITPKSHRTGNKSKSTGKKIKQSRLVKELAIDMVSGNPFLEEPINSRRTRHIGSDFVTKRRRAIDQNSASNTKELKTKTSKKLKLDDKIDATSESSFSSESNDLPASEDFIESSQETTFSIVSTTKRTSKKKGTCDVKPNNGVTANVSLSILPSNLTATIDTEPLIDKENIVEGSESNTHMDDTATMDTQSTVNLHDVSEKSNLTATDLTASIDSDKLLSAEPSDDHIIELKSPEKSVIGPETQEIAEADTEPVEPSMCDKEERKVQEMDTTIKILDTNDSISCLSSPFKDEHQRNEVFLNNTLNISPIQTMEAKHVEERTPEKSEEFVIIKLSSPVQSNGEPIYECDSPEIFTNDKISPNKTGQSPSKVIVSPNKTGQSPLKVIVSPNKTEQSPSKVIVSPNKTEQSPLKVIVSPNKTEQSPSKVIVPVLNTSPSLSLKKNRTQVRPSGRAAQMLSLCKSDKLFTIQINDENEESKKAHHLTPARRNLQRFYNMNSENTTNDNSDISSNENMNNFLKLQRSLPSADSSPIGPILKRKHEIDNDTPVSPASKKKRVSFHDPPVSTTVAVQKYIEVNGERSPQSLKRQNRLQRNNIKSPRQLESLFKSSAGLKLIESTMNDVEIIPLEPIRDNFNPLKTNDDTTLSDIDMDATPQLEVIHINELNDKDFICPELINNTEPFDLIAAELSSPTMKLVLVKELKGRINTIGDFAKLTELEVNRLCIKAPKVEVAKKALADYLAKNPPINDKDLNTSKAPVKLLVEAEVQSDIVITQGKGMQTDDKIVADKLVQTNESSTKDFIASSIKERPDFSEKILKTKEIMNTLTLESIVELLQSKISTDSDRKLVLERTLSQKNRVGIIQNYLCDNLSPANIVFLCSELLKKVHLKMNE